MSKVPVKISHNDTLMISDYSYEVTLEIKSMISKVLGDHIEELKGGALAFGELWTQYKSDDLVIDVFFDEGSGYEVRCVNEKAFSSCLSFVSESKLFSIEENT